MRYLVVFCLVSILIGSCDWSDESVENGPIKQIVDSGNAPIKKDTLLQAGLNTGLWAYYDFNGNLTDKSGNGRNMTGYNNIPLTTDLFGNEQGALDFDGFTQYAVIEEGTTFPSTDFTVSMLLQSKTLQGTIFYKVNAKSAQGGSLGIGFDDTNEDNDNNTSLSYNIALNDNICVSIVNSSTFLYITEKLYPEKWYLLTLSYSNGMQQLYINDKLVGTKQWEKKPVPQCSNATFNLGIWWEGDPHFFSGKMDELRIYTRALSAKEVQYLSGTLLPSQ